MKRINWYDLKAGLVPMETTFSYPTEESLVDIRAYWPYYLVGPHFKYWY